MNTCTRHRGPDATCTWISHDISLGHNRLKIIDLRDDANQPLTSSDGRYVIVFNGEIYNFKELRRELNYPFATESDTEVLLAGFITWGEKVVSKLNGIFAFAVFDTFERALFLARDHNGIKPLYYFHKDNTLIFASEIKAILVHPAVSRQLDHIALSHHLLLQYTPEPMTLFKDIKKFPAAHFAWFQNELLHFTKYWSPTIPKNFDRLDLPRVLDCIHTAVKAELVSDRPVGLYLSGGIDSSTILHFARPHIRELNTFSIRFDLSESEQQEKFNVDADIALRLSKHYETMHHELLIDSRQVVSEIAHALLHLEEPIANATIIPMFLLSRFAKNRVAVALSGEGGDELFGGYERYRLSRIANIVGSMPHILSQRIAKLVNSKLLFPPGAERYAALMMPGRMHMGDIFRLDIDERTASAWINERFATVPDQDFERQMMEVDRQTWLTDEALLRSDKMSMAHGLEMRVPLLERSVINMARSFPSTYHVGLFQTKKLLRKELFGVLPKYVLKQPKRGWFSPSAKWMRHPELKKMMSETFTQSYYAETSTLIDFERLQQMHRLHAGGSAYFANELWAVFVFQIWARTFQIHL